MDFSDLRTFSAKRAVTGEFIKCAIFLYNCNFSSDFFKLWL